MKKYTAILLMLVLTVGMLVGCGKDYATEESTIFIEKKGKVVYTDVKKFDEKTYDREELEEYVKSIIDEYTKEHGKKTVTFESLTVEDGVATLTLEFENAEHYTRFQGFEVFTGSMADALAKGYSFDAEFASIDDEKATICDVSKFYENEEYKVVIVKANTNVKVKGTICYVSTENVALVDESTVSIKSGNRLTFAKEESTESESATQTIDGTESGSVGEDELEVGVEESTEMIFEFEQAEKEEENGEFSSVYTYIIYK